MNSSFLFGRTHFWWYVFPDNGGFVLTTTIHIMLCFFKIANATAVFEKEIKIKDTVLQLNGTGLRTASFLKIKVYEAALYLKKKTQEISEIQSSYPKKIEMIFLRDVSKEDIRKAWDTSFPKNCEIDCSTQSKSLSQLKEAITDIKEKDKLEYIFWKDKVIVSLNDKQLTEISAASFAHNLLLTWIGKEPPTEELKLGLLGKP